MLGRWLEVKVASLGCVSLLQTSDQNTSPSPPPPAKHPPCYLLCSQSGSRTGTPAHKILSVLCNHTGPEDTDTGDYCFLELVVSVCNIQIIPTWLMMTNNNPTNNQPVLTLIVLCCVLYDIVEVDNDNYSCCNYTLFEIGLHNNSPSEALTHSNLILSFIDYSLFMCLF